MAKRKLEDDKEYRAKAENYIRLLLSGDKVTEDVTYSGFTFKVAYPLPSDLRLIDQQMAKYCGGMRPGSFTPKALYTFEVYATLDHVVVDGPDWWKNLASSDKCPFDDLIAHLYRRWLRFYRKVRVYLTPAILNTPDGGSSTNSTSGSDSKVMGNDIFQDLAYGPDSGQSQ